jgi:Arc/MetJ family transcription regulator
MGTNLVIDDKLMRQALEASGLASKKAVIEEGLRLLVKVHGQRNVRRLRGKIVFDSGTRQSEKGEQLQ